MRNYQKSFFSAAKVSQLCRRLDEDCSLCLGGGHVNGAGVNRDLGVIDLDDVGVHSLLKDHAGHNLALVKAGAQDLGHADVVDVESGRFALQNGGASVCDLKIK